MTPEQPQTETFVEIFKNQHEKVDTDEGESIEEEEKSTTSSDKSEQDSESDITTEDEDETNTTETHQVHNVLNETIHGEENSSEAEDDTSEEQNLNEMQTCENNEKKNGQENKLPTLKLKLKTEKLKGS